MNDFHRLHCKGAKQSKVVTEAEVTNRLGRGESYFAGSGAIARLS